VWEVYYHPDAKEESIQLPTKERIALNHAIEKLNVMGPRLPYPHQSNVEGAESLRELRPKGGRSPWRAFYRRIGAVFVIGAIGREAQVNRQKFDRAVMVAQKRLDETAKEKEGA
jgi:hypothetical protein